MRYSEILPSLTMQKFPAMTTMFLIIFNGATQLMTSFPCETKSEDETIGYLLDYFDLYQLNPKYIVGDQSFSGTTLEAFYNRKGIRFISLGPQTPWPNRA